MSKRQKLLCLKGETWTEVVGYHDYRISSYGRVLSFRRSKGGKLLAAKPHPKGYLYVRLWNENGAWTTKIHRLVANHFIDNPESKPQVNHIDENKSNNRVENLEWATNSENIRHSISLNGQHHYASMLGRTGDKSPFSRTIVQMGLQGETIAEHTGIRALCRRMGWNHQNISISIKNGGTAYGYKWKYKES